MIGIILAGGKSTRFGGAPKGLQLLRGVPLAGHVHASLNVVCREVLIECAPGSGYEGFGVETLAARAAFAGKGPLAGILAGLERAGPAEAVAFVPCDMPLVAPVTIDRLAQEPCGAHAVSPAGAEPLVCVLPGLLSRRIEAVLAGERVPAVRDVFADLGVRAVMFDDDWSFANINTPDDLSRLAAFF